MAQQFMPIENPLIRPENLRLRNVFQNPPGALPDNDIGQGPSARIQENPIFGQDQQVFGSGRLGMPPSAQAQPQEDPDGIRERSHAILDKFLESINQMPERKDYKRGIWGNIATGLIGAFQGGAEGRAFHDRPYTNDLSDWKLKNDALASAAGQERMANSSADISEIRAGDLARKIAADKARDENADAERALKAKQIELQGELANGGTLIHDEISGNTFILTRRGELRPTDIKAVSEAEKIRLATEGRLKIVKTQGEIDKEVAAVTRTVNTNSTTTTNDPSKGGISQAEDLQGQFNRAQELYTTDGEARPYIKLGETGTNRFDIDPNTPPAILQRIRDKIYGSAIRADDISLGGAPVTTTRSSTSTSTRGTPATTPAQPVPPASRFGGPGRGGAAPANAGLRQQAIDALTRQGAPVTEANIAEAMKQLGGK
jgi:hypothetical protein